MKNYQNLLEAIDGLRREGYVEDFILSNHCLRCHNINYDILHHEFEVDKFYRFDVDTDPNDQSIIYAISSEKFGIKGILINSYGLYSDQLTNDILEKLTIHGK